MALRSISADSDNGWSWYNLGYIYQVHLQRIPDAIEAYRRSVSLDPNYVRPWENLGALLAWEANDTTGAGEAFLKARSLGGMSAYGLNHYGVFLREHTDRFQEAEEALWTAISLEPLEWCHRVALAVLYEKKLARYSDARELLLDARNLGAPLHDIEYRLALSSQRLRRMISSVPRA